MKAAAHLQRGNQTQVRERHQKTWGYDEFDAELAHQSPEGIASLTIPGKDKMAGFLEFELITSTSTTTKATKQETAEEKLLVKEQGTVAKYEAKEGKRISEAEAKKEEEEQK